MSGRSQRRQGYLERYHLPEAFLRMADKKTGRFGLIEGTDADGQAVLIKMWPRTARQDDSDVEGIWRHELRQLHRLAGHPQAQSVIARLRDAGQDDKGFYLVLDPGQRQPLHVTMSRAHTGHWLRQPRNVNNRLRMWRNLRQIASALEAIHSEGLLHRDLDAWSILTAAGDEPDFQLTGFEWSMRLMSAAADHSGTNVRSGRVVDSFRDDWKLFAELVSSLIGADWTRVRDLNIPSFDVAEHLLAAEVRLLRNLAGLEHLDRLDGELVVERIDQLVVTLSADAAGREMQLHLVVNLAQGSKLTEAVARKLQSESINLTPAELEQFVRADLSDVLLLVGTKLGDDGELRLSLRGHDMIYRLSGYRAPRTSVASWEFAFCDMVEGQGPAPGNVVHSIELPASAIEIVTQKDAPTKYARSRGRVRTWEGLRRQMERAAGPPDEEMLLHRALTLTLLVELLFGVAGAYPVRMVGPPAGYRQEGSDETDVHLVPRSDTERDELSNALGLASPGQRLGPALTNEMSSSEGWILTTSRNLGARVQGDTEWKFDRTTTRPGQQEIHSFTGPSPPDISGDLFLVPEDAVGSEVQLKRRLKALEALRNHAELLRVLNRPNEQLKESHEAIETDEAYGDLDASKQVALRSIIETLPLFLVQGPPGVGKTRLVRELVKRRFADDPSIRVMLTAQSHAAVDHLLAEVMPSVGGAAEKPLVVRSRSARKTEEPGEYDIGRVSRSILESMADSDLVRNSGKNLRSAFEELRTGSAQRVGTSRRTDADDASGALQRRFEGVVTQAANIVFSTTNSGVLERLLEDRSQFDWTIVEEAGKATGTELLTPLLLSHRRLIIGDHKQLPPFGADAMEALLKSPENVVRALRRGADYIDRSLRGDVTDAIVDEIEDDEDGTAALCAQALRVVMFFQSMIEDELKRRGPKSRRSFASRLNEQHRMHPAIAEMVSEAFYADQTSGGLTTHRDSVHRFKTEECPLFSRDPKCLPDKPIILIDMPSRQAMADRAVGDRRPPWHNPDERAAVAAVLSLLEARPGVVPPTLAVLSPYSRQVGRLDTMIKDTPELAPSLRGFAAPTRNGRFCHTVDSFQGSEADVAVISLVRNNHHTTLRSALGFLADARRMNVLLSRAKWRLVLVGSFDFLQEILDGARIAGDGEQIAFLDSLFATFAQSSADDFERVPASRLMGTRR